MSLTANLWKKWKEWILCIIGSTQPSRTASEPPSLPSPSFPSDLLAPSSAFSSPIWFVWMPPACQKKELSWCQVSRVGLRGSDLSRPLDGWRALARTLVCSLRLFLTSHKIVQKCNNFEVYWLGRLCLFCCGFHYIKVGCYTCHWDFWELPGS